MEKGLKSIPVERTIFDDEEQRRSVVALLLCAVKCPKTLQMLSDLINLVTSSRVPIRKLMNISFLSGDDLLVGYHKISEMCVKCLHKVYSRKRDLSYRSIFIFNK